MNRDDVDEILRDAGVTPTPNRALVLRAIAAAPCPVSLAELEDELETLEKSSISRVLNLLESQCVIHALQDGRGIAKYELCHGKDHVHSQFDMHTHFYCTRCRRTYCFEHVAVPRVEVPPGFRTESVNYMLKGLCPSCQKKED